jgi:hypothetical protein
MVSGAIHMPYRTEPLKNRTAASFVREGYCHTTPIHDPALCNATDEYEVRDALFQFDGALWSWDPRALEVQWAYEEEVKAFGYSFSKEQKELVESFG